jgi:hypothetical protein
MEDTDIRTTFVALTGKFDHFDAVRDLETLAGHEITAGSARLAIGQRVGNGDDAFGYVGFEGHLHTGSALVPALKVEIVVTPWSSTRTEIGVRPLGRLGRLRTDRFLRAAWPVVEALIAELQPHASPTALRVVPSPQRVAA